MGRPTPQLKNDEGSKSKVNKLLTPRTKAKRNFMGASKESLGFAAIKEKRIVQRYNRKKKRESMEICDSVNNIYALDTKNNTPVSLNKSKRIKSSKSTIININYEKIQEERQVKLEELQSNNMHEKEVKKRINKRKRITKHLLLKTKRGQPLMGNHVQHLLGKIQSVTSRKGN